MNKEVKGVTFALLLPSPEPYHGKKYKTYGESTVPLTASSAPSGISAILGRSLAHTSVKLSIAAKSTSSK